MAITTDWGTVNLADLVPTELQATLDALNTASPLIQASATAAAIAMALSANPDDLPLPNKIAVDAALALLDALLADLVAAQVSYTGYTPIAHQTILSGSVLLTMLANSFYDETDTHKPVDTGDSPQRFMLWVVVATADKLAVLHSQVQDLLKLIGKPIQAGRAGTPTFLQEAGGYPPVVQYRSSGQLPRWESTNFTELGMVKTLVDQLLAIRGKLAGVKTGTDLFARQAALTLLRASEMVTEIGNIASTTAEIASLAGGLAGVSSLFLSGSATLREQTTALEAAIIHEDSPFVSPDNPNSLVDAVSADAGASFMAIHLQGPDATVSFIEALLGKAG